MEHRVSDCLRRATVVRDQPIVVVPIAPTSARGRDRGRGDGGRGVGQRSVARGGDGVDFGVTRLFILRDVARDLGIVVKPSRSSVMVNSPLGDSVVADRVYRRFDIILCIDWLSEHQDKLLSNVSSSLRAEKLVRKGCKAYLAYILNADSREMMLDKMQAVYDFSDALSEEFPRLPLNTKVEFGIELYPGTALMTVAPYCMAPKELKELKLKLQELLDRGFIRLSVSPWGAPALLVKKMGL
ncbi:Gag protease polyprotein-like protein [Gossypium australe]|uniref:Gag protease polyprotein-like protein n=1 Tax=Gossypium australe TaxID=47621 RepID=A0A5B6X140_9ROSI|nr:Gag protease polyprotein-like protein [Gossypium australe]